MRTNGIGWWLGAIACLAAAGCCDPPLTQTRAVTLRGQEQSNWCWAASGQMVMNTLGASVTQCDEVNRRYGRTDCCNTPTPSACNQTGWPEPDRYGFTFRTTSDAPLTWAQVKEEIHCGGRPFAFSWHWPGGTGHMMVVTGYKTDMGTNYMYVSDPLPQNAGSLNIYTYDYYNTSPGHHTHWNDYYAFVRTGGD